jgi:hypothetical protein
MAISWLNYDALFIFEYNPAIAYLPNYNPPSLKSHILLPPNLIGSIQS